jgi:hypothetical protein
MANKDMTAREFYTAVIALANVPTALSDYAKSAIAKLDEKNANRKVSKSALAHKAENDDVKGAILAALSDGKVWVAATLSAKVGVSTQKISALTRQLADDGKIVVSDVKIQGKGKVKGYALADTQGEGD